MYPLRSIAVGCATLPILVAGCMPTLPENIAVDPPERSHVKEANGAIFSTENGLNDALWIDIPRLNGSGTVGGYLSNADVTSSGLVILLHGASSYEPEGSLGHTRHFHQIFGNDFRQAGYRTLSLDFRECGAAYGQEDTADLVTVIDWLVGGGSTVLGVKNVYVVGYSVGATAAIVANRQRKVAAIASISGLTEPLQLQQLWVLFALAASIYPNNEGLCQVKSTLSTYGLPWSHHWDILDTVRHVDELKSPMLIIQGTQDQLFNISNAKHLDAAYQQAILRQTSLPVVEFLYLQGQDHFSPAGDPTVRQSILAFFDRFGGNETPD